ncbi:MAG: hypothetical protein WB791_06435 [Waddliaceae bacterium]
MSITGWVNIPGFQTRSVMFGFVSFYYGQETAEDLSGFRLTVDNTVNLVWNIFLRVIKGAVIYMAMTAVCPPLTLARSIGVIAIGGLSYLLSKEISSPQPVHDFLAEAGKIGIVSGCLLTMACAMKMLGLV